MRYMVSPFGINTLPVDIAKDHTSHLCYHLCRMPGRRYLQGYGQGIAPEPASTCRPPASTGYRQMPNLQTQRVIAASWSNELRTWVPLQYPSPASTSQPGILHPWRQLPIAFQVLLIDGPAFTPKGWGHEKSRPAACGCCGRLWLCSWSGSVSNTLHLQQNTH